MSILHAVVLSNNHDSQIHNAARHPVELDMKQVRAVEARIELDLRIGAAFTRLMTMNLSKQIAELDGKMISYGMFLSCKNCISNVTYRSLSVPHTWICCRSIPTHKRLHIRGVLVHFRVNHTQR